MASKTEKTPALPQLIDCAASTSRILAIEDGQAQKRAKLGAKCYPDKLTGEGED